LLFAAAKEPSERVSRAARLRCSRRQRVEATVAESRHCAGQSGQRAFHPAIIHRKLLQIGKLDLRSLAYNLLMGWEARSK
jgi:hypothetical protein